MHIQLKKGTFLCSDQYQFWIQREWLSHRKNKDGKEEAIQNIKRLTGYHTELATLFDSYFDKQIRTSEAESIEDLIKIIEKTRKDIRKWLKELRGTDK